MERINKMKTKEKTRLNDKRKQFRSVYVLFEFSSYLPPNMPQCMSYMCKTVNTSVQHPISNEMIQLDKASYDRAYISSKAFNCRMLAALLLHHKMVQRNYLIRWQTLGQKKCPLHLVLQNGVAQKSQKGRRIHIEAIYISCFCVKIGQ